MGVVKRQGIKTSIVKYAALPIGVLASVFIYPYSEQTNDTYGLYNYLFSFASLLMPFFFLGIPNVAIRFFPVFEDKKSGHNGFLRFLLTRGLLISIICGVVCYLFVDEILFNLLSAPLWLNSYSLIIFILAIILGFISILTYYTSNFNRIVVPTLIETLRNRIVLPVIILLIGMELFPSVFFAELIIVLFLIQLISLFIYLRGLGQLSFSVINSNLLGENRKEIVRFSLYAVLATFGTSLCSQIDSVMVTELMDIRSTGVYSIGRNISNVIAIPVQAVFAISAPIVAKLINENKNSEVSDLYKKSTNTLTFTGVLIFLLISISIVDILVFMNNKVIDYSELEMVFYALGLAIIFNMLTSINAHIIIYSKYYRFNVVLTLILGVSNIVLNYLFISVWEFGLVGAAYASALSLVLYDLIKTIFVYVVFKMSPITTPVIKILALGIFVFIVTLFIPQMGIFGIFLKGILVFTCFLLPVLIFKWSPEINSLLKEIQDKMRKFI